MTISPVLCAKEYRQNIVRQFAYDELNQLVRSAPVAKISTKVYNYNRNCVWTGKLTAYGSMAITYDAIGNPSGIRYKNGSTTNDYYFVCNWRGDVIQIYNASGVLVATYDYDAWGKVSENSTDKDTQNIAEINPIRYRGYYYDSETGLYYVNSRYYDPAVKRFLNSDDDLLSATSTHTLTNKNYFAYCDNNPVGRVDTNGTEWLAIIGISAASGLISSIDDIVALVTTYKNGGDTNRAWLNLGVSFVTGTVSSFVSMVAPAASNYVDAGLSLGSDVLYAYLDYKAGVSTEEIAANFAVDVAADLSLIAIGKFMDKNVFDPMENQGEKLVRKGTTRSRILSTRAVTPNILKGISCAKAKIARGKSMVNRAKRLRPIVGSSIGSAVSRFSSWLKGKINRWRGR